MLKVFFITTLLLVLGFRAEAFVANQANDAWVTVFYQVAPDHSIIVKDIKNGTQKTLSAGHYLEAYLPRNLFPKDKEVTPEVIHNILPLLTHDAYIKGFRKMKCGAKIDLIDHYSENKLGVLLNDSETESPIEVNPDDLQNGNTIISAVLTENKNETVTSKPKRKINVLECPTGLYVPEQNVQKLTVIGADPLVAGFEKKNKKQIDETINWARLQISLRAKTDGLSINKSTGCCEAFVSRALMLGGLTPNLVRSEKAVDAGGELEKQGFKNILSANGKYLDEKSAPRGAVLVYSGGKPHVTVDKQGHKIVSKPDGHVAIKTEAEGIDGYISDFVSEHPPTAARTLIGIYIKP